MTTAQNTAAGYICKICHQPSPVGVGFVAFGAAASAASHGLTACKCGHSVAPAAEFAPCDTRELARQIGQMNILAISGGRIVRRETGLTLPVGHGYTVTVDLAGNDTYTVRRVFTRAGKVWVKGEVGQVYCDQVGEIAYQASCFVNVDFGVHKVETPAVSGYTIAAPADGTRPAVVIAQIRRVSL